MIYMYGELLNGGFDMTTGGVCGYDYVLSCSLCKDIQELLRENECHNN
jgi:hypothetical protein